MTIARNALNRGAATSSALPGPYAWADLPVSYPSWKPILLEGGTVIAKDPRTDGNLWVPYYLRNFDMLSSINADTYVPGAPPAGWAEAGAIPTIVGGCIHLSAVPIATTSLIYTIAGLGVPEWVFIACRLKGTASAGSDSNYTGIWLYDSRRNDYVVWGVDWGNTHVSRWYLGAVGDPHGPISANLVEISLAWNYETVDACSWVQLLDIPRRVFDQAAQNNYWALAAASDQVSFSVRSAVNAGGLAGILDLEHAAIYKGAW